MVLVEPDVGSPAKRTQPVRSPERDRRPPRRRRNAPPAQPPAGQVTETRIAAVVNDEVISVADVMSRLQNGDAVVEPG